MRPVQKEGGLRAPSPAPQDPSAKAEVGAIRCISCGINPAQCQVFAAFPHRQFKLYQSEASAVRV